MKLTERQWGGYKGKYKNHVVEVYWSHEKDKFRFSIKSDAKITFWSEQHDMFYETKEEVAKAAINEIDKHVSISMK